MTISKKIISHLLAKSMDPETHAEDLANGLLHYAAIDRQRWRFANRRQIVKDQCEAALKQIDLEEAASQQRCDHPDTHYNADSSGGGDSFSTCNICGKDL